MTIPRRSRRPAARDLSSNTKTVGCLRILALSIILEYLITRSAEALLAALSTKIKAIRKINFLYVNENFISMVGCFSEIALKKVPLNSIRYLYSVVYGLELFTQI